MIETEICEPCEGKGEIERLARVRNSDDPFEGIMETCITCFGEGEVVVVCKHCEEVKCQCHLIDEDDGLSPYESLGLNGYGY